MGKKVELTASDGFKLGAYVAEPSGKARGAVVVMSEIFGVNPHIRSVVDGFAADGYLSIAPQDFDRAQKDYEAGYAQEDMQAGIALMQKVTWDGVMMDAAAAIAHVKSAGKVGIVGYCRGGTSAYLAACRLSGLSAAVCYYPGYVENFIGEKPKCPLLFQFGETDKMPSPEIGKQMLAAHPNTKGFFYPNAGHGFNADPRGSYNPEASKLARERTIAFFREHLG